MNKLLSMWMGVVGFILFFTPTIQASPSPTSARDVLTVTSAISPSPLRQGESSRLEIRFNIKPDWYIYSVIPSLNEDAPPPTRLTLDSNYFTLDGPVYETRPHTKRIEALELEITYHKEQATIYQNLKVNPDLNPGHYHVEAILWIQACTDTICLPGESLEIQIPFSLEEGDFREEFIAIDRSIDPPLYQGGTAAIQGLVANGFWAFIALAALMGLFSLLTPCVFPMIPITVTYFSKQSEGKQSQVVKLALLFIGGIIFTYTVIGLLMSVVFGAGSALRLASNPIVNLIIGIVFVIFAFSLMGFIKLTLPPSIENFFDSKARKLGGVAGVLLMGFTFTLTAFTCTVQFVGTMLIAAAQGEWIWPVVGMLVFSTVFSFPFFLLAIAPGLINKARGKSGQWMGRAKVVLGILELMASVKFLSNADLVWQTNLISRNLAIAFWLVLLVVIIGYLFWTALRPKLNRSPLQWAIIALFILATIGLSRGWNGKSLGGLIDAVLPPVSVTIAKSSSEKGHGELVWLDSYSDALKNARESGKSVFIEFTGYTCVNCRWMEQNILTNKKVQSILSQDFVLVKLYTDGGEDGPVNLQFQIDRFQTVALPFYAVVSSDGNTINTTSGIIRDAQDFIQFLDMNTE